LDRVREALFSSLGDQVVDAAVLDLFSGSGAQGIEALSRGAKHVVFVDSHPGSVTCIRQNLQTVGLAKGATVLPFALPEGLARVGGSFDIILADPPYGFGGHDGLLAGIVAAGLLQGGGQVVVEHGTKVGLPESVAGLTRSRERRYGNTVLSFYA
jgi:16S rRNA (guanine(966)-N(2))-methyltransferase RsmD